MRPLLVVLLHEAVELRLLMQEVLAGGASGFLLQRQRACPIRERYWSVAPDLTATTTWSTDFIISSGCVRWMA